MQYNTQIIKFGKNPKNVGTMDQNDADVGYSLVGSPSCGDFIELYIKIKKNKVNHAKFKAFGCTSAIASIEYLTRILKNKSIEAAQLITNKKIYHRLKLPPIKYHCSVLAEEAISEALKNFFDKSK